MTRNVARMSIRGMQDIDIIEDIIEYKILM
jgi:Glu-tRNA(Gln) amidotransferase subunit E-like FAD-binding protein